MTILCDGCGAAIDYSGYWVETPWGKDEFYCADCDGHGGQEFRICDVCGEPMIDGFTDEGNGSSFYCHDGCFEQAMDGLYGKGGWRVTEDDGCGGYYEWFDRRECEWCGTGIYYTEWS